ncbi:kinase-like protein [Dendrothele bispora CBS 962.96]|uniref:Kinase-like protein n=1 Tax=Dendrothele bispora (strain CBS 962.96) TaxID=1314807 RepID=A0A4S8LBP8_DENBC|nr:kinase-like protein [Dendrothele bispora CBS 962.96]
MSNIIDTTPGPSSSTDVVGSSRKHYLTAHSHSNGGTDVDGEGLPRPLNLPWVKGILIGKGVDVTNVYLGLNSATGKIMAVKQFKLPNTATRPIDRVRLRGVVDFFQNEVKMMKDLDHKNVVKYLGWVITPGYLTLLLEYVPGGTIATCLQYHGRFQEEITKSFTMQLLDGLSYLHGNGIIHKALKGSSILVDHRGTCKISQFAFSERTQRRSREDKKYLPTKGRVFWMAPEVIEIDPDKWYDEKLDIWSLGCVVMEMWTGVRPWNGLDDIPVMFKLAVEKVSPPLPEHIQVGELGMDFKKRCFERSGCPFLFDIIMLVDLTKNDPLFSSEKLAEQQL